MKVIASLASMLAIAIGVCALSFIAEYLRLPKGADIYTQISLHSANKAMFLDWLKTRSARYADITVSEQNRQNLETFANNFWQAGGKASEIEKATSMIDVSFQIRTDHWPSGRYLRYWLFFDDTEQCSFSKAYESYQLF